MNAFAAAKNDLLRAKDCFTKLKECKDIKEFENLWRDLAGFIGKCYYKVQSEGNSISKQIFNNANQNHNRLMKTDELLIYLKEVRNTDQHHNIVDIIEKQPAITSFTSTGVSIIKAISINHQGRAYVIGSGDPVEFKFTPEKVIALPVPSEIQGKLFYPPKSHNWKPLKNPNDIFEIAELGISYYESYLKFIENYFQKKKII